jgi:uncharacterized protein (UPF0548 family)
MLVHPGWPETVLMLSPFVLVPAALFVLLGWQPIFSSATLRSGATLPTGATLRSGAAFRAGAALLAALSFVPDEGLLASILTIPWLAVCVVVAVIGANRLLSRRSINPLFATDIGLVYLVVGASWLTFSRAGANPMGFSDTIVALTAVHFHFAGLALPIVAGTVANSVANSVAGAVATSRSWLIAAAVVAGVPFTAAGIIAGGDLEWIAASFMAVSGLATAWLLFRYSRLDATGWARGVSSLAALGLATGMALALGWSWSVKFGWRYFDVEMMARTHGSVNAFGFCLLSFAALVKGACEVQRSSDARVFHAGMASESKLQQLRLAAEQEVPTSRAGLLLEVPTPEGYRRDIWTADLPHGFEAGRAALQAWASQRAAAIAIEPRDAPLVVGTTVALAIPLLWASLSATCRIVATVDEPNVFGFTYATLPHHPEDGEESFIVERRPDGSASYTVTAVWRPAMLCTRLFPPLTRWVQRRATIQYVEGVAGFRPL